MKKELIIAIVFGILLGLVVAFVMVTRIRQMEAAKASPIQTSDSKLKPATSFNDDQTLEISEPLQDVIVNKNPITIKGKAQKNSLLVVQSVLKDVVLQHDKQENFSILSFPLVIGENIISVTVYPKDKQLRTQERTLRVYYLDEK